MTLPRHGFVIASAALALASCADQPVPATTESATAEAGKPATDGPAADRTAPEEPYKKPVRMNGRGEISSVDLSEAFALQESGSAMIFDARPAFFYNLGHLPGAINIPAKADPDTAIHRREAEIEAALAAGKTLIVYCTSWTCPDARTLARHLSGFGYPSSIFGGGWDAWREAGLPTE